MYLHKDHFKDMESNAQLEKTKVDILHETVCFISDDMEHDTCFV